MPKRGRVELYLFLAFALIAAIGLTYTMLYGIPEGMAYRGPPYGSIPLDPSQFQSPYEAYAGGMIPTEDQPGRYMIGTPGSVTDCQAACFGTEPGRPSVGQQPLGGEALRQCLADCQAGIMPHPSQGQECYTCSCPTEAITADNEGQARMVCQRICGSTGRIIGMTPGPCNY
ncbi:MAG: hypothetical protein QW165_01590 [Candidatus Woesearchaeota archaeon]